MKGTRDGTLVIILTVCETQLSANSLTSCHAVSICRKADKQ